jgi:hypothetical protein
MGLLRSEFAWPHGGGREQRHLVRLRRYDVSGTEAASSAAAMSEALAARHSLHPQLLVGALKGFSGFRYHGLRSAATGQRLLLLSFLSPCLDSAGQDLVAHLQVLDGIDKQLYYLLAFRGNVEQVLLLRVQVNDCLLDSRLLGLPGLQNVVLHNLRGLEHLHDACLSVVFEITSFLSQNAIYLSHCEGH